LVFEDGFVAGFSAFAGFAFDLLMVVYFGLRKGLQSNTTAQ
jgi:hypothetical protein